MDNLGDMDLLFEKGDLQSNFAHTHLLGFSRKNWKVLGECTQTQCLAVRGEVSEARNLK